MMLFCKGEGARPEEYEQGESILKSQVTLYRFYMMHNLAVYNLTLNV